MRKAPETIQAQRAILIADEDEQLRKNLAQGLSQSGFHVFESISGEDAIRKIQNYPFYAVICDMHMPDFDGLDILREAKRSPHATNFILLSKYPNVSTAVEAMRLGANDFIEKPVSVKDIYHLLDSANLEVRRNAIESSQKKIVGNSNWLEPFFLTVDRIAKTNATVLIEGETGTGKSAVAELIWKRSDRYNRPMITINCAAIPDQLLESEFFGHVKGAFTGATQTQLGKVEQADGGILFLDEIGELHPDLQAKILHLLQNRQFTPVGASHAKRANIRFIAATNRSLNEHVAKGHFRADLYYRLNVLNLQIPALRERPNDISILINHFQDRYQIEYKCRPPKFTSLAIESLKQYSWPGNIRELENLVERYAILFSGNNEIDVSDLPSSFWPNSKKPIQGTISTDSTNHTHFQQSIRDLEKELIQQALNQSQGNRSEAARILGLKRTTLLEKIRKYKIDPPLSNSEFHLQ